MQRALFSNFHFRSASYASIAFLVAASFVCVRPSAGAADFAGEYVITQALNPGTQEPYRGTVSISGRKSAYSVRWRLEPSRPLSGIALRDGDFLCVSYSTGGPAHGVAIYKQEGTRWTGRWISSIDSGGTVGQVEIADADALPGRHRFTSLRPGAGRVDGAVNISPRAGNFALSFSLGGMVLYRGIGVLQGDRLFVAWSYGSSPALMVYELKADELFGKRVAFRSGELAAGMENLARAGTYPALRATASPPEPPPFSEPPLVTGGGPDDLPGGRGASVGSALMAEPEAPPVKEWTYGELMGRYSRGGFAERWLEQRLTSEERRLFEAAAGRYATRAAKRALAKKTVAELIEEQRKIEGSKGAGH